MVDYSDQKHWIAVYTKSRHEKLADEQLQEKQIETFLPLIRQKRRWSDRLKWVDMPLFKSYLFAHIPLRFYLDVLQTPGVHHIVRFRNEIAIVPDFQIKAIKIMLEGDFVPEATDYFIVGDQVIVEAGPLKGIQGIVSRVDGEDKLVVKIDAIRHAISVHITRAYLRRVK